MRILILSTNPPRYSAGLGEDVRKALQEAGHQVDFISRNEDVLHPASSKVLVKPSALKRILRSILSPAGVEKLASIVGKIKGIKLAPPEYVVFNNGYEIHYPDENAPGIPVEKLIDSIDNEYDLVITLWWFGMLTSVSLNAIWQKLKCPILIYAIDMAPMTGGCFYFRDCRNFMTGCGNCPALDSNSPDDYTHRNYLIKKFHYSRLPVGFLGNSWMNRFAVKSGLFTPDQVFNVSIIVDDKDFTVADPAEARKLLPAEIKGSILLLARSSAEPRKGANHIVKAVCNLWESLSPDERREIEVITVGDSTIHDALTAAGVNSTWLGRLDREQLIRAYQAATYFLSASEDDAGPSMVNQAMMCGTPVIAFDNGTAVDVITDGVTGFKSSEISFEAFAQLISRAYELAENSSEYEKMRKNVRSVALEFNSPRAFARKIEKFYNVLKYHE